MVDSSIGYAADGSSGQRSQHWVVVGAGMLGLAAALKLTKLGHKVTVVEAAAEIGGLASAWNLGNARWDKFYHVVLLSDSSLRALLDELGLEQQICWKTTRTGFYTDGRLHSLSSSLDFLRFKPLSLLQKFRLGCTIFYASRIRGSQKLESITVEQWLRKLSGDSTFERIWRPLLLAKLGSAYRRTSAMFIWSYIDRMYKARRSGMKREMFGFVPGGYGRILDAFKQHLQRLGVDLRTSFPVHRISRDKAGQFEIIRQGSSDQDARDHEHHPQEIEQRGIENRGLADQAEQRAHSLHSADANGSQLRKDSNEKTGLSSLSADRVLITLPNSMISKICPQLSNDEHQRLQSAEYLGVCCTSLLLDQPLGGYYVTNITDSWVPLTGIIEMGAIVPAESLDGGYLVYLPQYMESHDPRFDESDSAIHERCLSTLEKMYPNFSRASVRSIQTARARHVMTLPTLGYSQQIPSVVSSLPGLYLLNSAQITVGCLNVNEVIEVAHRLLDQAILPHSAD